jgi:hypothetical protein
MPLMSWQLWLAKDIVVETRLPWQSATLDLSPGRVAQSMFSVLVEIVTPARLPKPRGKSPGWNKGNTRSELPHTHPKRVECGLLPSTTIAATVVDLRPYCFGLTHPPDDLLRAELVRLSSEAD